MPSSKPAMLFSPEDLPLNERDRATGFEDRSLTQPGQAAGPEDWILALDNAFVRKNPKEGYLPLAEQAERACPGEGTILYQAALAALLDRRPDRAQLYLKRFAKRYVATQTHHLLAALTLAVENKMSSARAVLERNHLTSLADALPYFPGGWAQRLWLFEMIETIMGRVHGVSTRKSAIRPVAKARPKHQTSHRAPTPRPPAATPAALLPALERMPVEIPISIESDLRPLLAAAGEPAEEAGSGFELRERLAHFGLAQGFDELLCLPHLRQIEAFWYQTETVRKVLKQFHGRVLLADEVGLGKTVEAGMVLKEYLLRGMVDRVLVLVPAALVGQWHEELATKFDLPFLTTQDRLLRDDPDAFWAAPRLIASMALARRHEHAERLLAQPFDIVIVDEAHHLRDRASQSYKLVDRLTKRFLLLLSATPVQNNLLELYNLLTLLKPGIFKTQKEFRTAYMVPGKPRQPANPERLRDLMRNAMIRNTRAVVALKLPRRHASTRYADAAPSEASAYQALTAAVRARAAEAGGDRQRLALHHLIAAAGSSPAAASAALNRVAERRAAEPIWRDLAHRFAAVGAGAKERELLDLLARNPAEKKLIFINHRETLDSLAALLARRGLSFARFEGSLSGAEKDEAIAEFRDRVPILLCTQSGGEGRNMQFCNTLINFDIPWNPMAIEQRIGRIDRIGQTREVFVFNLVTRGTAEEQVIRLLDEKINMFQLVIGEAGVILGDLDEERGFADLVLEAWLEASGPDRAEAFEALARRVDEARSHYDDAKALDEALFGEEFETA